MKTALKTKLRQTKGTGILDIHSLYLYFVSPHALNCNCFSAEKKSFEIASKKKKKENRNNCDLHSAVKNIYEENRSSKCKHALSLEKEQNANSLSK